MNDPQVGFEVGRYIVDTGKVADLHDAASKASTVAAALRLTGHSDLAVEVQRLIDSARDLCPKPAVSAYDPAQYHENGAKKCNATCDVDTCGCWNVPPTKAPASSVSDEDILLEAMRRYLPRMRTNADRHDDFHAGADFVRSRLAAAPAIPAEVLRATLLWNDDASRILALRYGPATADAVDTAMKWLASVAPTKETT